MNFGKFLKSSALFWLVILKTRTPGCLLNVFFTFNLHLLTRRNWHQSTAWKAPVFSHILIGHFGFGFSRIRIFALSNTYTFHEVEVNKKFPGNRKNYLHSEKNNDHKIVRNLSFFISYFNPVTDSSSAIMCTFLLFFNIGGGFSAFPNGLSKFTTTKSVWNKLTTFEKDSL